MSGSGDEKEKRKVLERNLSFEYKRPRATRRDVVRIDNIKLRENQDPIYDRMTREDVAMLLALIAQQKPDCVSAQEMMLEWSKTYADNEEKLAIAKKDELMKDLNSADVNIVLKAVDFYQCQPEVTGACFLDSQKIIRTVEGSGFTHAAVAICTHLGELCKGGTMFLSHKPCSQCVIAMVQAGVHRFVYPKAKNGSEFKEEGLVEPSKAPSTRSASGNSLPDHPGAEEDVNVDRIIKSCGVALTEWQCPSGVIKQGNKEIFWKADFEKFHVKDDKLFYLAVSSIAAFRSEDQSVRVGAVLVAKEFPDTVSQRSQVLSVAYNGTIVGAFADDFKDEAVQAPSSIKKMYAVHAEMNAFVFASPAKPRFLHRHLYTTHSPCHQCSGILIENHVSCTSKNQYRDTILFEIAHNKANLTFSPQWKVKTAGDSASASTIHPETKK
jgi:deoxycytidylate deaminase